MMEKFGRNLKGAVKYLVFAFAVYLVMLYFTLPYENIADGIIEQIEREHRIRLKVGSISPSLPLGFKARAVEVSGGGSSEDRPLNMDSISVTVPIIGTILYPFTKNMNYRIRAAIGKGELRSDIRVGKALGEISLDMESLNLDSLGPLISSKGLEIKGVADGKIALFSGENGFAGFSLLSSTGEMDITTKDLNIALKETDAAFAADSMPPTLRMILSIIPFSFKSLSSKIVVNKGLIELKSLSLEREGLTGKISGVIKIEPNPQDSLLDIGINLRVAPEEKLLRPLLSLYGERLGCPIKQDDTVSCKINTTFGEISGPSF